MREKDPVDDFGYGKGHAAISGTLFPGVSVLHGAFAQSVAIGWIHCGLLAGWIGNQRAVDQRRRRRLEHSKVLLPVLRLNSRGVRWRLGRELTRTAGRGNSVG